MLRVSDVVFRYDRSPFELRVTQLAAVRGQALAIVGPSGSGKTTLLHLIAGILLPQAGEVVVDDLCLTSLSDAKRRDFRISNVGFVFQDFELVEYLNVRDNIQLPCWINRSLTLSSELRGRVATLADAVGIGDKLRRSVQQLSQGERQRVAVCRALLTTPGLLLADEPTGNLDPKSSQAIVRLLVDYARAEGATLIVVTHDHSLLPHFDRVVDFSDFLATMP